MKVVWPIALVYGGRSFFSGKSSEQFDEEDAKKLHRMMVMVILSLIFVRFPKQINQIKKMVRYKCDIGYDSWNEELARQ